MYIECVLLITKYLFVAFIDMEKEYDRVNMKKLFQVMRRYGMQENLVDVIRVDSYGFFNGSLTSKNQLYR